MTRLRLISLVLALLVTMHGSARSDARIEKFVNPTPDRTWTSKVGGWFAAGKSVAVVVGISNYVGTRSGGYPALPSAKYDADKMRRFLLEDAGFDVVYVLTDANATKEQIDALMTDRIPAEVGEHDRFLFYWSGHGDQMISADKSAFGFLPLSDSKLHVFSSMISMEDIARWDRYLSARHALFMIDACLSGLAGVEVKSARDTRLDQLSQPAHQLITAGTATENVISSDRWQGSLFTDSFIRGARSDARQSLGVISLYSLIDFVQERVSVEKDEARWSGTLTPQIRNLRAGDGAFFFTRSASVAAVTPQAATPIAIEPKSSPAQPSPPAQPATPNQAVNSPQSSILSSLVSSPPNSPPSPPKGPPAAPSPPGQQAALTPPPPPPVASASTDLRLPVALSDEDKVRFRNFEQNRADAIREAREKPESPEDAASPRDLADLGAVLAGGEMPITPSSLIGEWRCRTLKIGGILPLTIYDYFKCRISKDGNALIFQKTSGSQRTRGTLYPVSNTRYVYVGAGTVNDDPPIAYGEKSTEDEVAYLVQVSPKRLRLEFPKPKYESHFNIIDLVR